MIVPFRKTFIRFHSQKAATVVTFYSVFQDGFTSSMDLIQDALEIAHSASGFPWWTCIVGGTLVLRALLLPVKLRAIRNHQSMALATTEWASLMAVRKSRHRLLGELKTSSNHENFSPVQLQRSLFKRYQCSPIISLLPTAIYLPLFLLYSSCLRRMTAVPWPFRREMEEEVVVDGMKTEGIPMWCPDLTLADPPMTVLVLLANFVFIEGAFRKSAKPNSKCEYIDL